MKRLSYRRFCSSWRSLYYWLQYNNILKGGLQNTIIGDNCLIQSGTIIGEDCFAFKREEETSELEKFPHYGKVIIKNNVEIFSNYSIAKEDRFPISL
jgi:ADP-glucose pyrophosphorylase